MQIISFPNRAEWPVLLARPTQQMASIEPIVAPILAKVKAEGDAALRAFALEFDKIKVEFCRFSTRTQRSRQPNL
jgi:histidinol dehydrogenase